MATIAGKQVVEIYLDNQYGVRIGLLEEVLSYSYSLLENEPGPFSIKLPYNFSPARIDQDYIIEIWRGIEGTPTRMDYSGFVRTLEFGDEAGIPYTIISGSSVMEILTRRIALDNGAVVTTTMELEADDMLKAIFKDQFGSDAIAARDLTATAGGVTVQSNLTAAEVVNKEFKYRPILDVMQEIALASKEAGTALYFDVVPITSSTEPGMLGFEFRTFTGQRGTDRTFDSLNPVFIGPDWENLVNGKLIYDYSKVINHVTVLGKGEGNATVTVERSNTGSIGQTIWNRREGMKNSSNTDVAETTALEAEGDAFLQENKSKLSFTGDIQETQYFRYGYNWFHGDRVSIRYLKLERDANISKVFISKDQGPEIITAKMEIDE